MLSQMTYTSFSMPCSLIFMALQLTINITYVRRPPPSSNGPPALCLIMRAKLFLLNNILHSLRACHALRISNLLGFLSSLLLSIQMVLIKPVQVVVPIVHSSYTYETTAKAMHLTALSTNLSTFLDVLIKPLLGCTSWPFYNVHHACTGDIMSLPADLSILSVQFAQGLIKLTRTKSLLPKASSTACSSYRDASIASLQRKMLITRPLLMSVHSSRPVMTDAPLLNCFTSSETTNIMVLGHHSILMTFHLWKPKHCLV